MADALAIDGGTMTRADVVRDLDVRRAYARDASGLELIPEGVVRPSSIE